MVLFPSVRSPLCCRDTTSSISMMKRGSSLVIRTLSKAQQKSSVSRLCRHWNQSIRMASSTSSSSSSISGQYLSPVWSHLTTIRPVKGEGIYLYDKDNNRYIDFTSGIGVTNLGHCHPNVVKAIQEQASEFHFGQMNVVIGPKFIELSEKLNSITPPTINNFFFANSGAEATEAAVKLARHATKKTNVIVFQGSFHGRTHQCMAMTTSKYIYREKYQPLPSGIFVTPFPYSYYYGQTEQETIDFCMKELNRLVLSQTSPAETAAIFIEPVLGEGGYVPVPNEFLKELRQFCTRHNILLVVDEIQSGFGRTGKLFAFENTASDSDEIVTPDILIMAKGLGNGMPISAIGASSDLMSKWKVGTHGGTYGGGNAIVANAAIATIDTMINDDIPNKAAKTGLYLMKKLHEIQQRYPIIGDVRGKGLMVATEFTNSDGTPNGDIAKAVRTKCVENKLLILTCGTHDHIIRWIPPLIVTENQIVDALHVFEQAVKEALS